MSKLNKLKLSGTTYELQDLSAQPLLSAGTGIQISGNVISCTGGSGTIDPSLDSGSTNAVANSAITEAVTVDTVYTKNADESTIPSIGKKDGITKVYLSKNELSNSDWVYCGAGNKGSAPSKTATYLLSDAPIENEFLKIYLITDHSEGYFVTVVIEAKAGYNLWNVSSNFTLANVKTFKTIVDGGTPNVVIPLLADNLSNTDVKLSKKIDSAVSGKADTSAVTQDIAAAVSALTQESAFTEYTAATEARLGEDEEVTARALNELNDSVSGKQDTLIAGSGITISGNVISTEGVGKPIEGGRGITVTTRATADTVSFNLPISAGTSASIIEGDSRNVASGIYSHAEGYQTSATSSYSHAEGEETKCMARSAHAEGRNTSAIAAYSHAEGYNTIAMNASEHASGEYNISRTGTTFADRTLFSVGDGASDSARHNAFEIRRNGDIYISSGGTDIKLQDNLGGGSVTIDTTLDSGSTNAVANSAITTAIDDINTRLGEDEEVTARALTELEDVVGGKLDASAYTPTDLSEYWTSGETQSAINAAASGKADTTAVTQDIATATNDMATQTWVGNQGFITGVDLSNYATFGDVDAATSGKVDTSVYTAYTAATDTALSGKQDTLSAGTNITISGNVISAEGGGKAVTGGTNISVNTGETADTINCTLPIYINPYDGRGDINIGTENNVNSDYYRIVLGRRINSVSNANGAGSIGIGVATTNSQEKNELFGSDSIGIGRRFQITNNPYGAIAIGRSAKVSVNKGLAIGYQTEASGTTQTNINNQLKIDTSNQIYIKNKENTEEICLQDYLGGGTVDPSLDSGSTNAVANSAITAAINAKQDTLVAGSGITISGNVISASGGSEGYPTVELTQAEYDALVSAGTVSQNTYYIITDAQSVDITDYWTSAQTQSAINSAVSGKQDKLPISAVTTDTLILNSANSYGNTYHSLVGGSNNNIGNASNSIVFGDSNAINGTVYNDKIAIFGYNNQSYSNQQFIAGGNNQARNQYETALGAYNVTTTGSSTSEQTLFSIGNGSSLTARSNAFEVRKNGDIYITLNGQNVKLQDILTQLLT